MSSQVLTLGLREPSVSLIAPMAVTGPPDAQQGPHSWIPDPGSPPFARPPSGSSALSLAVLIPFNFLFLGKSSFPPPHPSSQVTLPASCFLLRTALPLAPRCVSALLSSPQSAPYSPELLLVEFFYLHKAGPPVRIEMGCPPGTWGERSPRGLGLQRTGVRCQRQEGASPLPTSPQRKSSPDTLRGTRFIPPKTHFGEDPSSHPQEAGTFQNGASVSTRVCQALGRGTSRNPPAAWGHVCRPCGRGTQRP